MWAHTVHFPLQLYQTYRPLDAGGSIVATSEPDTQRVPDISTAYTDLASSSNPDLHRALRGMVAAEELPAVSFSARHESPSIPEDVQVRFCGADDLLAAAQLVAVRVVLKNFVHFSAGKPRSWVINGFHGLECA